jgi:YceI-like domain
MRVRQGKALGDIDRLQEVGSVSLVIDAKSYNSNIGLRDQDVQEYYLEVQQYPVIRFDSTGIQEIERPPSPEDRACGAGKIYGPTPKARQFRSIQ